MPGEENPELESAVEQASTEGAEQQTPSYVDDQGQGNRLLQTSGQNQNQGREQGQGKFYGGKYRSIQDYDKSHRSLEQKLGQTTNRAQMLEKLIQNPGLQERLAADPESREILKKLGFELMEEESREDERSQGGPARWDPEDPRCQIAQLRAEMSFKEERSELEEKIGRRLAPNEISEIKQQIYLAPKLTWSQAWKLTSHFEKQLELQQQKAIEKAMQRAPVSRPRPAQPGAIGGQKLPQGKSPLGLKDEDKAAFLNDLIQKSGG
jgi:hypothetical protein